MRGGVIDEREDDLKALGATPEQLASLHLDSVSQDFEVWEENWDTVMMFMRLSTQWQASMSGLVGLHYPSLEWLCKLYAVAEPVALFEGIQVMERTALICMNDSRKR